MPEQPSVYKCDLCGRTFSTKLAHGSHRDACIRKHEASAANSPDRDGDPSTPGSPPSSENWGKPAGHVPAETHPSTPAKRRDGYPNVDEPDNRKSPSAPGADEEAAERASNPLRHSADEAEGDVVSPTGRPATNTAIGANQAASALTPAQARDRATKITDELSNLIVQIGKGGPGKATATRKLNADLGHVRSGLSSLTFE